MKEVQIMNNQPFLDDEEKMIDFKSLSKEEFLTSYSYLTEEEYNSTKLTLEEELLFTTAKQIKQELLNKIQELKSKYNDDLDKVFEELILILNPHTVGKTDNSYNFMDFNYGCVCSTISLNKTLGEIKLSESCEVWNDTSCELLDSSYNW